MSNMDRNLLDQWADDQKHWTEENRKLHERINRLTLRIIKLENVPTSKQLQS